MESVNKCVLARFLTGSTDSPQRLCCKMYKGNIIRKKNVILGLKMLGPETLQSKGKTVYGVLTSSLEERNSALKIIGGL